MFSQTIRDYDIFTFTILFCVEAVMGILGNGFIALVNIMDWTKRRRISSVDKILTALALSRFFCVWFMLIFKLLFILCPHLHISSEVHKSMAIIWVINNHFSIWLATCLGIFYFLKIANFSNSFFLYLKWRVKKVLLIIILVSLIFLSLNILSLDIYDQLSIEVDEKNTSYSFWDSTQFYRIFFFTNSSKVFLIINSSHVFLPINSIFMLMPFSVSLVAFLMLIFSLWKHHKKMKFNAEQPRDARTMAHMKALQTVFSFLLLYTIYLLLIVIGMLSLRVMGAKLILLFDYISGIAFPISHSFVLILGNRKLRQATISVLHCMRCWTKDMDTMGP